LKECLGVNADPGALDIERTLSILGKNSSGEGLEFGTEISSSNSRSKSSNSDACSLASEFDNAFQILLSLCISN